MLAAESRVTLTAKQPSGPIHVNFDNATKLLSFSAPNQSVGTVTYGAAAIGLRTAHSFIPEFEASLPGDRLPVQDFTQRLADFYMQQWQQWQVTLAAPYAGPSMTFVVGGFNDGEPYGRVFLIEVPSLPKPVEQQPNVGDFGITWGGQREVVDRLLQGFDAQLPDLVRQALNLDHVQTGTMMKALATLGMPIPLLALPLQDCVDLAIFFIRTTIAAQQLTVGIRGCGGPIDVATITRREGLRFVQRKRVVGEFGAQEED